MQVNDIGKGAAHTTAAGAQARQTLEQHAAALLRHTQQGTFPLAPGVMTLDTDHYTSSTRFETEKRRVIAAEDDALAALLCQP